MSEETRWQVDDEGAQLLLDDNGEIPMRTLSQRHRGWDVLVLVTDLPRRAGTKPVVAGVDVEHGVAMISLPALGAVLVRHRARALLVRVVRQLVSRRLGIDGDHRGQGMVARLREVLAPTQRVPADRESAATHLALVGLRGRLRLLAGTAAYGIIADALSPLRLAAITVVTILVMTVWLTAYNHLWGAAFRSRRTTQSHAVQRVHGDHAGDRAGVHVRDPVRARAARGGGYFAQSLGHPVGAGSYLNLVWLCSSVGIVAGALGSSLEDEETVRNATYGRRERERQERNRRRREDRNSADSARSTQNSREDE